MTSVLDLRGEKTPARLLLRDLWRERGLLPMLAAKDFHARYRSASLGVLWSVFLPILQGAVLAIVFTKVVKISTPYSYPVFVLSGMVTWSYFSSSLTTGATAIVDASAIASKVYFPRLILPAVPALANLPSYAISSGVVVLLMLALGVGISPAILLLPLAMALTVALAIALSALVTLAHVYFRDVRYVVQATLMVALYATPVIYPLDRAKGLRPLLIWGNPMTGAIQLVRYAVFRQADSVGPAVLSSLVWLVVLSVAAVLAYRRHERVAVDRL